MRPFTYWIQAAHKNPAAIALAARINLQLPHGNVCYLESLSIHNPSSLSGLKHPFLKYPIRRLVVTGEDLLENFKALFGPEWEGVLEDYQAERIEVLMAMRRLKEGEGLEAMKGELDEGCPFWKPREASIGDNEEVDMLMRLVDDCVKVLEAIG